MRPLFRVAAGPQLGFGHLVRCRSLAKALGVPPRVSIRAEEDTVNVARARGFDVVAAGLSALGEAEQQPDVLIVDDPAASEAAPWVERARQRAIPVATLHDIGLGYVDSDLAVDGSVEHGAPRGHAVLAGPMFAILDPAIALLRDVVDVERRGVLIALGGGEHVHRWGGTLARAILSRCPELTIRITQGFARSATALSDPRVEWVHAPDGLATELQRAAVAVVAGGVTMYEGAALGTPMVAVAVAEAQQLTIRGFARRGAAIDAGIASDPAAFARAADAVADLIAHPGRAVRLGGSASHLIDGRGAFRVADAVRQLARHVEDRIHAA